jgi:hypothetical protein
MQGMHVTAQPICLPGCASCKCVCATAVLVSSCRYACTQKQGRHMHGITPQICVQPQSLQPEFMRTPTRLTITKTILKGLEGP